MGILKTGLTWLHAQRHSQMTVDVVYQRAGSPTKTNGKATLARFGGDTLLESELEVNSLARDFLFETAFFTVAGVFTPPDAGDQISIVGTTEVCEVSAEGADSVWRWSDPHRTAVRVHSHTVIR